VAVDVRNDECHPGPTEGRLYLGNRLWKETASVTMHGREERLDSWKAIAAYLNRSERTVRRWEEKEGLPVHRLHHDKRGSIYAYRTELDAWRESRKASPEFQDLEASDRAPSDSTGPISRWWGAAAFLLLAAVASFAMFALRHDRDPTERPSQNAAAQRAYERANFGPNPGRAQIDAGLKNYQEAVRLDPEFAAAWRGLGSAHIALAWFSESRAADDFAQARIEAQRAMSLDDSLGEPWRILGMVSHFLDRDDAMADDQFRKAMKLNPADPVAYSWFAETLINRRRFDEALQYARRAEEARPRWLESITVAGNARLYSGDIDGAIAEYERALEIEPGYGLANHFLGRAYLAKGQIERGIEQLRKSNEILGRVPFSVADLGYALAAGGHRDEAETMAADLRGKREAGYYPAFALAEIELGIGNQEAALDWLERAADEKNMGYYFPSADPVYEPLRSQPRFQALMERLHL
jgi:tetratricopeptide (TPR) repeat protein